MSVEVSQSNSTVTDSMFVMMESGQSPDPTGIGPALRRGIYQSCNFRLCLRHIRTHAPYTSFYRHSNYFAFYVTFNSTYIPSFFDEEQTLARGHHTASLSQATCFL